MANNTFSLPAPGALITIRLVAFLILAALGWTMVGHYPAPLVRADDVGVFISPSIVEVNLAPGASSSQTITVSSISPHTVQIASFVVVLAGQSDLSATDWIKVEPAQFLMAGFEEKTVEIKVVVPDQDLESGGRCALVGFYVKSVDPLQGFGVTDA